MELATADRAEVATWVKGVERGGTRTVLIEGPSGAATATVAAAVAIGIGGLVAFAVIEARSPEPMVPLHVDSRTIASVVSGWTGIPVGRMLADEIRSVLTLKERLAERIVGQPQALDAIYVS